MNGKSLAHQSLSNISKLDAHLPGQGTRLAINLSADTHRGDTLVVVFLRGAADVLNLVIPHAEEAYYQARPTLGIARPDDSRTPASQRAVDLDGFFGLHPAMAPLLPAWQAGHLGIVHACGAPDESRSHFKAQELMERGTGDESGPSSGWIGRHLAATPTGNHSPLRAVGIGEMVPRSLFGSVAATAVSSLSEFFLGDEGPTAQQMQALLTVLYAGDDELARVGRETLDILKILEQFRGDQTSGIEPSLYPESRFGYGLQQIAQLQKADVGLEVAAIDLDNWDTHFAQGSLEGLMAYLTRDLSEGLAAFYADLEDHLDQLTVVVMTEFGRRVRENASLGTDHGHGGLMLLLGGHVNGGQVHGDWPGLGTGQLFGPGDLAVTTDYRTVLSDVIGKRLNNPAAEDVFPGFQVERDGFVS